MCELWQMLGAGLDSARFAESFIPFLSFHLPGQVTAANDLLFCLLARRGLHPLVRTMLSIPGP